MQPIPNPPHSPETEQAVLGAALIHEGSFPDLAEGLDLVDFFEERHQVLWRAMADLHAAGSPIDLRTVQAALEARGQLDAVGGVAYLTSLDLSLPDLSRLEHYVEILQERTRRRQLLGLAQRLGSQAQQGEWSPGEIAAQVRRQLEELEEGPSRSSLGARDLVGEVLADAHRRREQRIATGEAVLGIKTGLPRLDGLLCGLSQGLYLLAGAPGVGKTTLALQIALHAAREGPVVYISFENTPASLLTKALCARASSTGTAVCSRDVARGYADLPALEGAAGELGESLERLTIIPGDGRLSVGQVRGLARRALERSSEGRCLVVVDYLQLWAKTARELRTLSDVRARVDALGGELVDLARRLGSPVLALSSQSRTGGAYGSGRGAAALDSLKESGDLEYAADVAAFLVRSEDSTAQPPAVAVTLALKKNRHGPTGSVPLIFRPNHGMREEVHEAEPLP